MIPYFGNGPYCYANTTSMLLATVGEDIPPARIEALTGVGLGAFWIEDPKQVFFSNVATPPDVGISKALELLRFNYTEKWSELARPAPIEELRIQLAQSPAILGPLDMGYLSYNPNHKYLAGADHFVLAYEMDDQEIYLHDPEGFPHVSLLLENLEQAWKAERIGYRRGYYRYWASPKRIHYPTEEEIYNQALQFFKSTYLESDEYAARNNWVIGANAFLKCANHVRHGTVLPQVKGHLVHFAFKLGARRALDFAAFFDFHDSNLAALKRRQAELFGKCHTLTVREDWSPLADVLQQLANEEEEFRANLLAR